jgi:ankyrin repeat protein
MTPLLLACSYEQTAVVRILLDNGADMRSVDDKDTSVLHRAAASASYELVHMITSKAEDEHGVKELDRVR